MKAAHPRVAVVGAGAVGSYFGGMLARAGLPVVLIGRPEHVDAIHRDGLAIRSMTFDEKIPVAASTEVSAAGDADLILLSVKTLDTVSAATALSKHCRTGAVVMSLQNGVDNVARIRSATGIEALPAVVYVAAEMSGPGEVTHSGRGDLVIGNLPGQEHPLDEIRKVFESSGIPCVVSPDIEGELWRKLVTNCAYNAVSALTGARYGPIVADPGTRQVLISAVRETAAVADAAGINLGGEDLVQFALSLGETTMPNATSSTAQDIVRGRKTEIDSLNGFVARRGVELGIPAPVNQTLHALIRRLEEETHGNR